jgi:acyl-CoA reductase-like NAD-dependent aldehyde dehydrogenase
MTTINDFCATYMAQSLPFGGVKESGFDRFAGRAGTFPHIILQTKQPLQSNHILSTTVGMLHVTPV